MAQRQRARAAVLRYTNIRCRRRVTGTLSTLVVDDEQLAREELSFLLKDFPEIEVADSASNGLEAVKLIKAVEPDLVFLDVQMPGLDGLGGNRQSFAPRRWTPAPFRPDHRFDQYAVEAFRLEALDYC